jgi:nucleoside-diphosphate-sugar epimerase
VAGADESAPYAERYETHYPATKAIAEREVLDAARDGLCAVALRPHLIWGPGDNHLVPRILARQRAGRLRLVGDGTNKIDATYIDNAAQAHIDALDRLGPDASCNGRAYFIANDEPMELRMLINGICAAGGLPPVTRTIPPGVAWAVGGVLEAVYRWTGRADEPMMTRFVARQLSTDHFYDLTAAKRDLGYIPTVSTEEGLTRLAAHLVAHPT